MRQDELNLPRQELSIIRRLVYVVVWFALGVREIPGSIPGTALAVVRLTPAASRLRSTATYFHPLTTHGFENAQLMLSWSPESYSEPGIQGGRPQILKAKVVRLPKHNININMFDTLSEKIET